MKTGSSRVYQTCKPLRTWQNSFTSHAAAAENASGSIFDAQQIAQQICHVLLQHEGVKAVKQNAKCFLELTVSEVVLGHELRRQIGRKDVTSDHVELSNAESAMRMLQRALDEEVRPATVTRVCEVMKRFQIEVVDAQIPSEQQHPNNEQYCALIRQHFRGSKGAQLHIYKDEQVH
jgi:hypothetical protein